MKQHILWLTLVTAWLGACAEENGPPTAANSGANTAPVYSGVRANRVIDYSPELPSGVTAEVSQFYLSEAILGDSDGYLGVVSLGDDRVNEGGRLTVGLGTLNENHCIVNGQGDDFVVHENVFLDTSTPTGGSYTEAMFVQVSEDSSAWYGFAPTHPDPVAGSEDDASDPTFFTNLAGITAGGDAFDLDDLVPSQGSGFRACYVRFVDAGTTVPDRECYMGETGICSNSGADLDALHVIHSALAPPGMP